ncbi:MAG: hypothetical protein CMJ50_01760 [Planctomycetaceae bacterium]|nr:hypothetical protein [Planctomycetaceae bacterium]
MDQRQPVMGPGDCCPFSSGPTRSMAQIVARVGRANRETSDQEWLLSEHLGLSSWLAREVVDRFMQALAL